LQLKSPVPVTVPGFSSWIGIMRRVLPNEPEKRLDQLMVHFVAMTWLDVPKSNPKGDRTGERSSIVSGFIMSVSGYWFWVTAGHICADLKSLPSANRKIIQAKFLDSPHLPHSGQNHVPFPVDYIEHIQHIYNEDSGIDYGVIILRPNTTALLHAGGVIPLSEDYWKDIPENLGPFLLLGIPSMLTKVNASLTSHHVSISPGIAPLRFEPNPPIDLESKIPRFYARLIDTTDDGKPNGTPLDDIDGMSGGPIFGLRTTDGDQIEYYLVAMQSSWFKGLRMICGCLAARLGEAILEQIET
jgi:hypothetical protein